LTKKIEKEKFDLVALRLTEFNNQILRPLQEKLHDYELFEVKELELKEKK